MNGRTINSFALAVTLMATTAGVYAAQKFDQITVLGFTVSVPHIASDGSTAACKVNMTREDGRTYCFSNDKALDAYMNDTLGWGTFVEPDIQKGNETFGFRGA